MHVARSLQKMILCLNCFLKKVIFIAVFKSIRNSEQRKALSIRGRGQTTEIPCDVFWVSFNEYLYEVGFVELQYIIFITQSELSIWGILQTSHCSNSNPEILLYYYHNIRNSTDQDVQQVYLIFLKYKFNCRRSEGITSSNIRWKIKWSNKNVAEYIYRKNTIRGKQYNACNIFVRADFEKCYLESCILIL